MQKDQPEVKTNSPLLHVPGIGKQAVAHLAKLKIYSLQDLLLHLPYRYQDRTKIYPIRQLVPGREALVEGVLHLPPAKKSKGHHTVELADGTGRLLLRFFHLFPFQQKQLLPGKRMRCYGEVKLFGYRLEMAHPEFKIMEDTGVLPVETHLTAIYPTTAGLTQHRLRLMMAGALTSMTQEAAFTECLPESILQALDFPSWQAALQFIHQPPNDAAMLLLETRQTPAHQRLVFEELLSHRLHLFRVKAEHQSQAAVRLVKHASYISAFLQQLPFSLTRAQQQAVTEIQADLHRAYPMRRLVQGDVGSGKTVVAALAILTILESGHQAAMMAPTQLLAEQHYRVFQQWFHPLGIEVALLSGSMSTREKAAAIQAIMAGGIQLVIGTHALFQDEVCFKNLGLIVVDEQHRFGVKQRALLREKGVQSTHSPHQLLMTATPIPRTLAMSVYADLDCSTIDELPPGRIPVVTRAMANSKRNEVVASLRQQCQQGKQAYWVCPLIEESDKLHGQAAKKLSQQLQAALPELNIGLIHGRMESDEKEQAMQLFQQGKTHLLVATTVIEVGVDVPNASMMVIENAERLGLAQLHQLRGRIGRGLAASYCLLLYQPVLSPVAEERLRIMRETTNGFHIAERDLLLRGPGELLGLKQTGELTFKVAELTRDKHLLPAVYQHAQQMMAQYPDRLGALIERWFAHGRG